MVKPVIYIDTVIARDWTHNRNADAIELLNQIKNKKIKCFISVFGLMELVDIQQEEIFLHKKAFIDQESLDAIFSKRKSRDLNKAELAKSDKYIGDFLKNYKETIGLVDLTGDGWSLALSIGAGSNLNATDVLHLSTAWQNECNIIVTRDEFFIREATKLLRREKAWSSLKVCNPKKAVLLLRKIK